MALTDATALPQRKTAQALGPPHVAVLPRVRRASRPHAHTCTEWMRAVSPQLRRRRRRLWARPPRNPDATTRMALTNATALRQRVPAPALGPPDVTVLPRVRRASRPYAHTCTEWMRAVS